MKDILKRYKKKKTIQNIGMVLTSLALGFLINMFIFDNSNITNNLKTNINESMAKKRESDLFLEKNNNHIFLKLGKDMDNVENISFSLVYNGDNINLNSILSHNKNISIMNLSNYPGVNTIVLNLKDVSDIKNGNEIINFKVSKKNKNIEALNLINGNFTDSEGKTYLLSTSGIDL